MNSSIFFLSRQPSESTLVFHKEKTEKRKQINRSGAAGNQKETE